MLQVGDTVRIIDKWDKVKADSFRQREYYERLAHPDATYEIEAITRLNEVYVKGFTNYFNYNLLEKC